MHISPVTHRNCVRVLSDLVTLLFTNPNAALDILTRHTSLAFKQEISSTLADAFELAGIDLTTYDLGNGKYLVNLDYSKSCRSWFIGRDPLLTVWCRGTYVLYDSKKGNVEVRLAFEKFFNVNENEEWSIDKLTELNMVESTRKADGTLLEVMYFDELGWVLATRKIPHFATPQEVGQAKEDPNLGRVVKIEDTKKIRAPHVKRAVEIEPKLANSDKVFRGLENYVLMFEIVDPYTQFIDGERVTFGSEYAPQFEKETAVYFLTARNMDSNYLLRYSEAHALLADRGFKTIEFIDLGNRKFDEIVRDVKFGELKKKVGEGIVVRFEGIEVPYRLVKVKTLLAFAHKKEHIVYYILQGTIDDVLPDLSPSMRKLAEELREIIPELKYWLQRYVRWIQFNKYRPGMTFEELRKQMRGIRYMVGTGLDDIHRYLSGKISFDELIVSIIRKLSYNPQLVKEYVKRLEQFIKHHEGS